MMQIKVSELASSQNYPVRDNIWLAPDRWTQRSEVHLSGVIEPRKRPEPLSRSSWDASEGRPMVVVRTPSSNPASFTFCADKR